MARPRARGGKRARGLRRRDRGRHEWVGGCLVPPFFITDRDEPYRPGLVVWLDVRDDLVVGQAVVGPEDEIVIPAADGAFKNSTGSSGGSPAPSSAAWAG